MNFKSLMVGAALCAFASTAFAYTTSSGTTTVTSGAAYPSQTSTGAYPHEDMGTIAASDADDQAATTTTHSIGTSAGSTPLRTVSANNQKNSSSNTGGISDAHQIGACLCMEQSYQSLSSAQSAKQVAYDQAVQQRATLDNQLASERAKGTGDVNVIRTTSEQRIALQGQINDVFIPQLQSATGQYNAAVAQYKASCAGKMFDATVEAQVQSTLQCHS